MVEKLKDNDLSTSMIENNQSFAETAQVGPGSPSASDWSLFVDLRSATNLQSRQPELRGELPSPFCEVSWSPEL